MSFASRHIEERKLERKSRNINDNETIVENATRDFLDLTMDAEADPEKSMTE